MLFRSLALASLASLIAADQSFTLTATGTGVSAPVIVSDGTIVAGEGSAAVFTLEEPSGYLSAGSAGYVLIGPTGISFVATTGEATKDFGIDGGNLRAGPADSSQWSAELSGSDYALYHYLKTGATQINLVVGAETETSSTSSVAPSSSAVTSSVAPATSSDVVVSSEPATSVVSTTGYSNVTYTTYTSHTTVIVTSCAETVTNCPARTTVVPVVITTTWCPESSSAAVTTAKPQTQPITKTTAAVSTTTSAPASTHAVSSFSAGAAGKAVSGAGAVVMAAVALLM